MFYRYDFLSLDPKNFVYLVMDSMIGLPNIKASIINNIKINIKRI